jgi:uncharacterized protein YndB with AHSA1/START domain
VEGNVTPDLRFDFVASDDKHTITVKREFAAKRQLVWDCHTKSELLDQWFAPKGLTTQTKHMDFREGGYWHYAMITPDNQKFWNRLDYKRIQPIDGYTAKDGFCDETGTVNADMPSADWDVSFSDLNEHTLVTTIVQYGSSDALQSALNMGLKDGLSSTLERLDELLPQLEAP